MSSLTVPKSIPMFSPLGKFEEIFKEGLKNGEN